MKKLILALIFLLVPLIANAQTGVCTSEWHSVVYAADATSIYVCAYNGSTWNWQQLATGAPGGIPTGTIIFIDTGACPTGYTEATGLNGKMWRGTLAANKDVGTSSGSDSITPAGTNGTGTVTATGTINTPTISWPVGVPANAAEASHTHSVTATGTIAWPAGVPTYTWALGTLAVTAHTVVATKQGTAAGNVVTTATHAFTGAAGGTVAWPAGVPTFTGGSATSGVGSSHNHAITWPAGVPTNSSLTFTGTSAITSAQTFTGTTFDNRAAYINLIGCKKN